MSGIYQGVVCFGASERGKYVFNAQTSKYLGFANKDEGLEGIEKLARGIKNRKSGIKVPEIFDY